MRWIVLALSVCLLGCPSSSSSPPTALPTTANPTTVVEVQDQQNTTTLAAWARSDSVDRELRYAALRRLEQLQAPETVEVASELAGDSDRFLRVNAIGVLARSDTPEANTAIAGLPAEDQQLARSVRGAQ